MKANELMIGDYVLYQGNPNRVYRILPDTVPFADAGRMNEDLVHIVWHDVHKQVNVRNIDPVPLTPEILEKNGFDISVPEVKQYHFEEDGQRYHFSLRQMYNQKDGKPNGYSFFAFNILTIIDYVHELQHALRLCGIEKEITI